MGQTSAVRVQELSREKGSSEKGSSPLLALFELFFNLPCLVIAICFWGGRPQHPNEAPVDTQKGVQDDVNKQKALRARLYPKGYVRSPERLGPMIVPVDPMTGLQFQRKPTPLLRGKSRQALPPGRGATAGETLLDCGVGLEGKSMKEWRWDSVCARCEGLVVQEGDDVRCLNCGARLFPEPAVPLQEKGQAGGRRQP